VDAQPEDNQDPGARDGGGPAGLTKSCLLPVLLISVAFSLVGFVLGALAGLVLGPETGEGGVWGRLGHALEIGALGAFAWALVFPGFLLNIGISVVILLAFLGLGWLVFGGWRPDRTGRGRGPP
jgi:hypothetical protein